MKNKYICLTQEELKKANEILELVLKESGDTIEDFNKDLTTITEIPIDSNDINQIGGWDAFEIVAKLIISGTISATFFGIFKASGWVLYYLTSCYEAQALTEICMSNAILPGIMYFIKEETKKMGHQTFNTAERQHKLAQKLRETYGNIDNFIKNISETEEFLFG